MQQCPVCFRHFEQAHIESHVQLHFEEHHQVADLVESFGGGTIGAAPCSLCELTVSAADLASHQLVHQLEAEELQQAGSAADLASCQLARQLEAEELRQAGTSTCPAGHFATSELDAELAAELAAEEWGDNLSGSSAAWECEVTDEAHHQRQLEELYFEQLRARYGFSSPPPRPGCCHLCGEEGHWMRDCSLNPDRQEAVRRVLNQPSPSLIAAAQQPATPTAFALLTAAGVSGRGAVRGCQPVRGGCSCDRDQSDNLHGSSNGSCGGNNLVGLLAACLQQQQQQHGQGQGPPGGYQATLCGASVMHYASSAFSSGWGCGYNNMQMLASHLLETWPASLLLCACGCVQGAREALFGGAGFVPDISALQAWLEVAWCAGFDRQGAEQLGGAVQGTRKWVGTTECAALLRYFGLRAQIVDFGVQHSSGTRDAAAMSGHPPACQQQQQLQQQRHDRSGAGPACVAAVHPGVACDACGQLPIRGQRYRSMVLPDYNLCSTCNARGDAVVKAAGPFRLMLPGGMLAVPSSGAGQQQQQRGLPTKQAQPGGAATGSLHVHGGLARCSVAQQLLQWVWHYFTSEDDDQLAGGGSSSSCCVGTGCGGAAAAAEAAAACRAGHGTANADGPAAKRRCNHPDSSMSGGCVRLTNKPPLYFQHEGHSRTIIGIERRLAARASAPATFMLLVLDPGTPGDALAAALQRGQGWQRLLRRGVHTLRHSQYQILFLEGPGLAGPEEREQMKLVAACQRY